MKNRNEHYGFSPDMRFSLKCLIARRPETTVSIIFLVSVFLIAYLLRIYEIVYYRAIGYMDFEQFYQSIWAVVITMGTVGFGDVVPVSHVGRLLMIFTTIWGTFLFTLVIVAFSYVFNLTPH
jgi:voltage-gated potassium channel